LLAGITEGEPRQNPEAPRFYLLIYSDLRFYPEIPLAEQTVNPLKPVRPKSALLKGPSHLPQDIIQRACDDVLSRRFASFERLEVCLPALDLGTLLVP